jgi:hypothetical protein
MRYINGANYKGEWKRVLKMGKVNLPILMEVFMKANEKRIREAGTVLLSMLMEVFMKANGKTI